MKKRKTKKIIWRENLTKVIPFCVHYFIVIIWCGLLLLLLLVASDLVQLHYDTIEKPTLKHKKRTKKITLKMEKKSQNAVNLWFWFNINSNVFFNPVAVSTLSQCFPTNFWARYEFNWLISLFLYLFFFVIFSLFSFSQFSNICFSLRC